MKFVLRSMVLFCIVAVGFVRGLPAQDDEEFGEDSHLNTNLGFTITTPLNPTAQLVNVGGGGVAGAGYNINEHHAFVGEFMWNRLGASDAALIPIRAALGTRNIDGHGDLFALTGNYRFELRGKKTGIYFIGGGGWYRRNATIDTHVPTGTGTSCTQTWLYWGFECSQGIVTSNQTVASFTADNLGVNGGGGVTFKVGEPRYRVYIEARYIYVPTKTLHTELIPITVGIRF
jgi:Outer membrane protein beta-barrel domain